MDETASHTVANGSQGTHGVADVVITALADMLKRPAETLSPDARLVQDLDFDSTSFLELLLRLEDDLDTEFDPDTFGAGGFETVASLIGYVGEQSGQR
ncbi:MULTISPECIES: phosphopantetheine-binding protein [unclassified Streptomyces]|uniref:phosphopantetheine-binding protein n=1 Tax=unclassified Streptomyces TaxID=2593676 RepID=UPI0022554ECF|nr:MULTISPECIES: phosphopantetheine-binding protein [unclassified Streptomyces]MCX5141187.1 phosphopantetheine-binding protein [Streptomyces sp. NBC_00338]WRZ65706.1 phosphopantetheine-binding protein [Streptomyces sp. NBC_01257]WSU59701.1 phosphopantetheine-binding protein [Streptomyces sp. NBC_01104]